MSKKLDPLKNSDRYNSKRDSISRGHSTTPINGSSSTGEKLLAAGLGLSLLGVGAYLADLGPKVDFSNDLSKVIKGFSDGLYSHMPGQDITQQPPYQTPFESNGAYKPFGGAKGGYYAKRDRSDAMINYESRNSKEVDPLTKAISFIGGGASAQEYPSGDSESEVGGYFNNTIRTMPGAPGDTSSELMAGRITKRPSGKSLSDGWVIQVDENGQPLKWPNGTTKRTYRPELDQFHKEKNKGNVAINYTSNPPTLQGLTPTKEKSFTLDAGRSSADFTYYYGSNDGPFKILAFDEGTSGRVKSIIDETGYPAIQIYVVRPKAAGQTLDGLIRRVFDQRNITQVGPTYKVNDAVDPFKDLRTSINYNFPEETGMWQITGDNIRSGDVYLSPRSVIEKISIGRPPNSKGNPEVSVLNNLSLIVMGIDGKKYCIPPSYSGPDLNNCIRIVPLPGSPEEISFAVCDDRVPAGVLEKYLA
jgi:hypothetical protein